MSKTDYEKWEEKYEDLRVAVGALHPYYDIDKVKTWAVYVWSKPTCEDEDGRNIFDIEEDEIVFYGEKVHIPDEVMPIIKNIQDKIRNLNSRGMKMKRQVRRGVFETNSSSMHSLVVMKQDQYYMQEEVEDHVYINEDGNISVYGDVYFGRSPFQVITSLIGKCMYVIASTADGGSVNEEAYKVVCDVIRSYMPNFKGLAYRDDTYFGVDENILTPFLEKEGVTIEEFLRNKKYRVVVDGDEYCIYLGMKKAGMIDKASIEKEYPSYEWEEQNLV